MTRTLCLLAALLFACSSSPAPCETCDGCCENHACVASTTFERCGTGGLTCVACSASTADHCGFMGGCMCGIRGACTNGQTCDAGQCS